MFQFPAFAYLTVWYVFNILGYPIRRSPHQRLFAPKRSFSQLITSFFASESLGIHHTPLIIYSNFILSAYSEIINVVKHLYNFCFCSLLWNIFFHLSSMSKNCYSCEYWQVKRNRTFSCSENLCFQPPGCQLFLRLKVLPASADNNWSPERRCSSRTFRYGYLVTT